MARRRGRRGFFFFCPSASGSESLRLGEEMTMGKKNAALRASDVDNKQTVALRGVSILPERADGFRLSPSARLS